MEQVKRMKNNLNWFIVAGILVLTIYSVIQTNFSLVNLYYGMGDIYDLVFNRFLPPDFTSWSKLVKPLLDTIYMSMVGTITGALLSIVGSLLAARTTNPRVRMLRVAARTSASVFRNIPAIIWAFFLVTSFGLGTLVGTISLIISTVGTLIRAYAEVLEEIDNKQLEGLGSTGAGYLQIIVQGVFPQVLPGFVAWTLYMLELNIRASAIVGMVGGGGIGFAIQNGLKLFRFQEVSLAIILVIGLVWITEFMTGKIRGRII